MSDYRSTDTVAGIAASLASASRVALVAHDRPDGDAIGSILGLGRALADRGATVTPILTGPIETALRFLLEGVDHLHVPEGVAASPDDVDLIVLLDTGAWSQVEPIAAWLRRHRDRVIGIDHHAGGDDVAPRRLVDPEAAATAEVLLPVLDAIPAAITPAVAEALFVGLATDTGWFRFVNADSSAFAAASRLLAAGVDKGLLYARIEETFGPSRLAIEARALASVAWLAEGRVAVQCLAPSDFAETGARSEDLTGLVNRPLVVGAARVSVLLSEAQAGTTKMSFRSKAAAGGVPACDVNQLAKAFGGGGHPFAAGARFTGTADAALAALTEAIGRVTFR